MAVALVLVACATIAPAPVAAQPPSVAVAAPSTLVRARPSDVGFSDALIPRLDSIITAAIADSATPGATIAVGRRGRLVLLKGYGRTDWAPRAPAANDSTMYDMASLTKVVSATTAAMILEEEGTLDLDRTVASYLPEYDVPDKRAITVRMLLTHTSGIRSFHPLWKDAKGRDAYLAGMIRYPLLNDPGRQALYTDWNMVLLQLIIERITNQTLDQFMETRVFGPLGMRDTRYNPAATLKPRIAPTEVEDFRGGHVWGVVHDETAWVLGGVSGNAGLFSSARDLAVFMQMLLNGGTYGSATVVRPTTVARWTARQRPDASRALGWDTPSRNSSAGRFFSLRSFGHTGFTGTSAWADPEKELFVVLLTNRVNPTRNNQKIGPLRRAVADVVQQSIVDAPLRDWEALLR
ncbi:MAG TPA: serine hydrolase domain-containing protein [Gemmatimonadaceae bacterium]|jgi:CubicO group peptidase (beta-lactamase class C family)|nr:serine hydrolase domain-containing protein [Gemmatimonadaceae bacterium]